MRRQGSVLGGVGLALAPILTVQAGAGLAVSLFDPLGPAGTALARQVIAAIVILALVRPRIRGRSPAQVRLIVAFGLTLGLMNWAIYAAMDELGLGVAVTLEFLGPLGVAVAGSRRALDLCWVLLAAGGVVLLTLAPSDRAVTAFGVGAALLAGACWAAYILLSRSTGAELPGLTGLALAMPISALVTAPVGIAEAGGALLEPRWLALAAVVAVACSVVPYSLEVEALRRLPTRVFGILMSVEPAAAAVVGVVALAQALSVTDCAAIACVVVASAGAAAMSGERDAGAVPARGCEMGDVLGPGGPMESRLEE